MRELTPEGKRAKEAEAAFRAVAGQMRAFANSEPWANYFLKRMGYDPNKIATALIGFSNEVVNRSVLKHTYRGQLEKLLGVRAEE